MNIRDAVIQIIVEALGVEPGAISDESNLKDNLGAGSPQLLEMALAIEELFLFGISDRALGKLYTVGDVVAYVKNKTES